MNKPLARAASAAAVLVACTAHAGEQDAYAGVAADAVTTGAALAAPGVVEANPLGWVTVPIRAAMIEHAKTLPRADAQPIYDAAQAGGWGAAANNMLVLIGAANAAPFIGLAVSYIVWSAGEKEREFWRLCSVYQSRSPETRCAFRTWRKEDVMRVAMEQRAMTQR